MRNRLLAFACVLMIAGCSQSSVQDTPSVLGPEGPQVQDRELPQDYEIPPPFDLTEPGAIHRGTTEVEIIDTRKFEPQIYRREAFQGEPQSSGFFRPKKDPLPPVPETEPNDLPVGGVVGEAVANRMMRFPGIDATGWNPPDPALAVGPNHVVEVVNSDVAFYQKNGTLDFQQRLGSQGSPGFFEPVGGGTFCFDPKCFYDHHANRFFVLALEVYTGSNESYITLAVSDDDDPNGIWYKYRTASVVTIDGNDFWVDYPGLGYDETGYYITGNLFPLSGGGFGGVLLRTFDKTPLLVGGTATFNDILDTQTSSAQVAQNFGTNAAPYIVSRVGSTLMKVSAINDPHGNPSLTSQFVSVPSGGSGPNAPNNNGGNTISTLTGRLMNVQVRDGQLWFCHTIGFDGGTRSVARWYEINVGNWPTSGPNPSLRQSGNIDLGSGQFTFFPAIYTNDNGTAAIVYANSSSTEFASVKVSTRFANDPLGQMSAPTTLVVGTGGTSGRWGDYFDIALDPDGLTFWMVGEYIDGGGWATNLDSINVEPSVTVLGDTVTVTRGNLTSGGIAQLSESDNTDLSIVRNPTDLQGRTEFEVEAISPYASPSGMEIRLEGAVFARSTVIQTIELFNYDTDSWEEIDSRNAARFTDAVATVSVSGDASRFVQPGTNRLEARIEYTSVARRQAFSSNTDQLTWTIDP